MKRLKDFKKVLETKTCGNCGKSFTRLSSISVRFDDGNHFYQKSHRPFISIYKMKLCDKCYLKTKKKILDIVL